MQYLKNTTLPEANGLARNISDDDWHVELGTSIRSARLGYPGDRQ